MPKQKDLKRLVRTRMQKTGEPYTTARVQLLKKQSRTSVVAAPDYAALAGMSEKAVRSKTGRSWEQWVRILDAVDATKMPHRAIAELVHGEYGVPGWWSQAVTVGYERIRGLREIGQRRGGGYEAGKSKTYPVALTRLYKAFSTERARGQWLAAENIKIRTAIPDKSMRMTWTDGTSVELYFTAKGPEKSQVAVQHRKLATKADVAKQKQFWSERLGALAEILGAGPVRRR